MPKNDLTFLIGGEAGQGVESSAAGFSLAMARGGLHVFKLLDYRSRIRGGHNFARIRRTPWSGHRGAPPAHPADRARSARSWRTWRA